MAIPLYQLVQLATIVLALPGSILAFAILRRSLKAGVARTRLGAVQRDRLPSLFWFLITAYAVGGIVLIAAALVAASLFATGKW